MRSAIIRPRRDAPFLLTEYCFWPYASLLAGKLRKRQSESRQSRMSRSSKASYSSHRCTIPQGMRRNLCSEYYVNLLMSFQSQFIYQNDITPYQLSPKYACPGLGLEREARSNQSCSSAPIAFTQAQLVPYNRPTGCKEHTRRSLGIDNTENDTPSRDIAQSEP